MLFLTWLVSRSTEDLVDGALAPAGLTGDEFALYSVLASGDGATPTLLARWMAAPATTVSSYVKRLEGRGHVIREANPEDRRSYRLTLTDAGRRAHADAQRLFRPLRAAIEADLGAERVEVDDALLRLRGAVDRLRAAARGTAT